RRLAVMGLADDEGRRFLAGAVGLHAVGRPAALRAEHVEDAVVETLCLFQVVAADHRVADHAVPPRVGCRRSYRFRRSSVQLLVTAVSSGTSAPSPSTKARPWSG